MLRWRACATCHNQEVRGEVAPTIPEYIHPTAEDIDPEMTGEDVAPLTTKLTQQERHLPILERMKELTKRNMPNTITFIPHRVRKRFARIYSSKLNELAALMRRGEGTPKRELLNLIL